MPVREGEPDPESAAGGPRSFELQARHSIEPAATGSEDQVYAREQQERPDLAFSCHHHGHFDGHRRRRSHSIYFRFRSLSFLAISLLKPFQRILSRYPCTIYAQHNRCLAIFRFHVLTVK